MAWRGEGEDEMSGAEAMRRTDVHGETKKSGGDA